TSAPNGKAEIIVLHFPDMKTACFLLGVEFDHIVGPAKPERRAAAKGARTYHRERSVDSIPKPSIEELRAVLVTVKAKTEPAINEVLYEVRVHVVGLQWRAFRIVMPDGNAQPILHKSLA